MNELIKVIAFDADDTLWSNEPFFQEVEKQYTHLDRKSTRLNSSHRT